MLQNTDLVKDFLDKIQETHTIKAKIDKCNMLS